VARKAVKAPPAGQAARGAHTAAPKAAEAVSKKVPVRRRGTAAKRDRTQGEVAGTPKLAQTNADPAATRDVAGPGLDTILEELRSVKRMLEQLAPPSNQSDAGLDASVDSLRRLLTELLEQRMESVVRDLVDVRREAAGLAGDDSSRIVARLEALLERLGAVRFEAEPMDVVDPLIHVVVDERQQADVPDGLILETVRPGYRTARGLIVCKAAVAVNQRP
jgi:molecular chaperone GrpE (heat shock protein)